MSFPLNFKALTLAAVSAGAVACSATTPSAPEADIPTANTCQEPRPQVCTTIYAPVCARHADGHEETHASACNACADDTTTAYRNGACEEEPASS